MSVQIFIPTALRGFVGGRDAVAVDADSVDVALTSLTETYPDLKKHLYTNEGQLRSFVNIYLNDEDIRFLEAGASRLKDGDTLSIVPSIAGGSAVTDPRTGEDVELNKDEVLRYSRHLIMPEVALEG